MTAYNVARARDLGAGLKAARLRVGLTQAEVARRINRQHSRISKWERGEGLPSEADLGAMLMLYEIAGEEHDEFVRLARAAADPNWVESGVSKQLASLIESERVSRRIVNVEPMIVPGLCQTEGYTRAMMVGAGGTPDQVNQWVTVRRGRQALIEQEDGPELEAIIGEYALRYPPCARSTMIGQLQKLLHMSGPALPNVSIFVLPLDLHGAYTDAILGSFSLIVPRYGEAIVRQEHVTSTTTLSNARDVRTCQAAAAMIRSQAMDAEESAAFIDSLLTEME